MQTKKITEHDFVKICMVELCKKAGFADPGNLVQRDLNFLCDDIESKTGVLISLSTIKRLLNGQFSRLPQVATLDAIAMSAGYQNWRDFKLNQGPQIIGNGQYRDSSRDMARTGNSNKFISVGALVLVVLLVLTTLCLFIIVRAGKSGIGNADKAQFSALKVTGNDIPNTVVFKYNIDSVDADSFFIQQSWDKRRRVRIQKHNHILTDIYYEPGYHTAKLIANDKIIKQLHVSIPTGQWLFYAKEKVPKSVPKYILATKGIKEASLLAGPKEMAKANVSIDKDNEYVYVYFPSVIKSSSDNFVLKFKIRVLDLKNSQCPYFMSEVFCQNYFMYFKSTLKGCTSELDSQFGENALNGKTSDLSQLGSDVLVKQNVEFKVINRNVSISINNIKVFTTSYRNSCGLITGLGFMSNGLCSVDSVDFKTIDGKNIYNNDFEYRKAAPIKLPFPAANHQMRAKR